MFPSMATIAILRTQRHAHVDIILRILILVRKPVLGDFTDPCDNR